MSNWYDPDHLSEGKVRDISIHEENTDDWDCEIHPLDVSPLYVKHVNIHKAE